MMALVYLGKIQMELLGRPLALAAIPAVGENDPANVGEQGFNLLCRHFVGRSISSSESPAYLHRETVSTRDALSISARTSGSHRRPPSACAARVAAPPWPNGSG